jgi:hypothetical protein
VGGEHFLVADSAEEVAAAVLRVLDDPSERSRLSQAGRERMLSHHDWKGSMERLDRIIERCLAGWSDRRHAHNHAESGQPKSIGSRASADGSQWS